MPLFVYQEKVDALLRSGRSVILQAPTGAGKTRAALFPFLDGWRNDPIDFPRQCLYIVPMRVLANQFEVEYKATVEKFAQSHGLTEVGQVRVQTGARPNDRKFESDLIFMTVDQALSSFLTIPYSLGMAQANLNAGAVIGAYLIFDEFHLFPVDEKGRGALTTTLQMLQMLKGITPFVLMTATFSETMIRRLAALLDAEPLIVKGDQLADIPAQQGKRRSFTRCEELLTADAVWADMQQHQRDRVIVICNTVERAQDIGAALRSKADGRDVHVEVLHSRFFRDDHHLPDGRLLRGRDTKEADIRREFGEQNDKNPPRTWRRAILVATQVVEVGLNISCSALHSEVAPAAAIVQRAGRCARFNGESGDVFIYNVPSNAKGEPDYAPYLDEGQSDLCAKTWEAFAGYSNRVLDFSAELALVETIHRDYDTRLLDTLENHHYELREQIADTWRSCNRSTGLKLIRDIDNCTVLIHTQPNSQTIPDPYAWEGISVRRKRLYRWWNEAQEAGKDLEWMLKYPHSPETIADAEQLRRRKVYEWRTMHQGGTSNELATVDLLVINPALVSYDDILGFRFAPGDPDFSQPAPAPQKRQRNDSDGPFSYKRETYAEHIARLYQVYLRQVRDQTIAVQRQLAQRLGLGDGIDSLDRAIRLMIATHDIGKLNQAWQQWARKWQREARKLPHATAAEQPADYMYAHTDYDSDDRDQRDLNKKMGKRPNHAAESAWAALQLLYAISADYPTPAGIDSRNPLYVALISAIARHHAASAEGHVVDFVGDAKETKHRAARQAFDAALQRVGLCDTPQLQGKKVEWSFRSGPDLCRALVEPSNTNEMLLYLLLVRILRLCDQRALSEN